LRRVLLLTLLVVFTARTVRAQVTPAAGFTPPDDTPSVRVGVTLYSDFTYQQNPQVLDADKNTINPSSFNVSRSYINIVGNINHIVGFRITPDVTRESGLVTLGTGSSVSNDSLVFRIKYAFAQFNMDDWMTRGSWVRFGIQQTPLLDYEEGIYRYRFQGTTFTEREGFYNSADGGASFHYNFPSNYGDVHVGVYNGEGYAKPEVNDQKAVDIRGTLRPFARSAPLMRGLRVTGYYVGDHYVKDAPRTRAVGQLTYESPYLNAGFDYIKAHDQTSIVNPNIQGTGWSVWLTPRTTVGWEGLIRFDHMTPDSRFSTQSRPRTIVGLAYWFREMGSVQAALLVDYDGQTFKNFTPAQVDQKKIAVHGLFNF
jgi:hypothetical protein